MDWWSTTRREMGVRVWRYFYNGQNSLRLRGKNRTRLEKEGRPVEFDRTAVMYVSVVVLSHFRTDTTVEHYIGK